MPDDLSQRDAITHTSERRAYPTRLEVRAKPDGSGGTRYDIEGYASAYDEPYEMYDCWGSYTERVRAGAGAKTLSENPDVVFLLNHDGLPMARTKAGSLALSEDTTGLHVLATGLNGSMSVVRDVVTAIEDGILDEMSFAFIVVRQEWSPDYLQRDIVEYNINRGDVSAVTFGANPATSIAMRSAELLKFEPAARALYDTLRARFEPAPIDTATLIADAAVVETLRLLADDTALAVRRRVA